MKFLGSYFLDQTLSIIKACDIQVEIQEYSHWVVFKRYALTLTPAQGAPIFLTGKGAEIITALAMFRLGLEATSEHRINNRVVNTMTNASEFPRRNQLDQLTPAETAIHQAIQAVEAVGAHPLLTDAVILLGQAKDKVSDYIDERSAQP